MFTNKLNMVLPLRAWIVKLVDGMETKTLRWKKQKIPGAKVSHEGHANSVLGH